MDILKRLREGRSEGTDLRWQVTDTHREAAAEIERLRGALANILKIIDDIDEYQKRPERGDWGVECACCMGEMFCHGERPMIDAARSILVNQQNAEQK